MSDDEEESILWNLKNEEHKTKVAQIEELNAQIEKAEAIIKQRAAYLDKLDGVGNTLNNALDQWKRAGTQWVTVIVLIAIVFFYFSK